MEFKESLRIMRSEIGLTQVELAAALHVQGKTVSRWEVGESFPHISTLKRILSIAKQKGASERCLKNLESALPVKQKKVIRVSKSKLYPVDKESICDLVDDSHNAIYVSDLETDEILYANKKAEEYAGKKFKVHEKCYKFLYDRNTPCTQCPKANTIENDSSNYHMVSPKDGRYFLFRGRKLNWNGKPAHAQYFFEETTALESQKAYQELINQLDVGVCSYWVHDDGQIEMNYMSDGYFATVGLTRENQMLSVGAGIMNAVCKEDKQRVLDTLISTSKERKPFRMIYKVQLGDGSLKTLYARAKFIKRENSKSLYYCTIEDRDRYLTEEILFEFIKNVIYKPEEAYIDMNSLPIEFQELGEGLSFLGQCVREQKNFGKSLVKGDFEHNVPNVENGIAAPLKEVHGILKHLMWQSRAVAGGDYSQKLDHFGELSESFNSMVQQLKEREEILKQKNHQLENLLEMFKDITSDAPYYIMILQRETGKVTYLNKSAEAIKQKYPALYDKIYQTISSCYTDVVISIPGNGKTKEEHYQVVTTSHSKDEVCVYMIMNVTDKLEKHMKLEDMAYKDELTRVNNRRYSQIVMQQLQKEHRSFALAFVDLDHLKYCNDVFGHECGDQYIKEVCTYLQEECKGTTVCRVGGDEFIVIKAGSTSLELEMQFQKLSQKFIESYQTPFQKSFSFGISECASECQDAISLALDEADRKMYQYKIEHKLKIQYQDKRM